MQDKCIAFIDNILRDEPRDTFSYFYTLLSSPLHHLSDDIHLDTSFIPPINTRRGQSTHGPSFDIKEFRARIATTNWEDTFQHIPRNAEEYLKQYLRTSTTYVGYEIPPWLIHILEAIGATYIDFRIGPIRFGPDLYIALRSNAPSVRNTLSQYSVSTSELYSHAALIKATVQRNELIRDAKKGTGHTQVVFIGQTANDASLIDDANSIINVNQYADAIRNFCSGRDVLYKAHPYAGPHARLEYRKLKKILGQKIKRINDHAYQLFGSREQFCFISLSSGAMQEAKFFDRRSNTLFRPFVPLEGIDSHDGSGFRQIHFTQFISNRFWDTILHGKDSVQQTREDSIPYPNLLRANYGVWWGYDEYMFTNQSFWRRVVSRGSLRVLSQLFRFWK